MSKVAIIRVRGGVRVKKSINDTLKMLRLYRKNYCVVFEKTDSLMGMIGKVKDYVTYGDIDDQIYKELIQKRGEEFKGEITELNKKKIIVEDGKNYKAFFRLNPPKSGFGRKGIKVAFSKGGALGHRKEKINDIIKRML